MNISTLSSMPLVGQDLSRMEILLKESVASGDPMLNQVATYLIDAGGKRLRPALALSVATGGVGAASKDDLLGSVAVELVHLGSLYHDDVMDEASMRRKVRSVNARWGNLVAIVAGDYLLAKSAEIAADLGPHIASLLARTLGELCRGQIGEVQTAYSTERTREQYFSVIAGKTAALMEASCRVGALTSGLPVSEVVALTDFGRCFGMAFQLRDDILDIIGSEDDLGKDPGQDLAEGIYTLPVLVALEDESVGPELGELLGRPLSGIERDKARSLVMSCDAIGQSASAMREWIDASIHALDGASSPALRDALGQLSNSIDDDILSVEPLGVI
ncbi:MAG: polyprenyl synthetase family protein [Acidimicrobiales bacterium]